MNTNTPKNIYVDSRLDSLAVAVRIQPRDWIFSQGRPWLLLTPGRLSRLAARLGLYDKRVEKLVHAVQRHSAKPEDFCRPLGVEPVADCSSGEYPPVLCPVCDRVHTPHPLDAAQPCPRCEEEERYHAINKPVSGVLQDRHEDRLARQMLREREPSLFHDGQLLPNWQANFSRRLSRDWDAAVNRILMGGTYRAVAKEFNCSVGLLHRKVRERNSWENN